MLSSGHALMLVDLYACCSHIAKRYVLHQSQRTHEQAIHHVCHVSPTGPDNRDISQYTRLPIDNHTTAILQLLETTCPKALNVRLSEHSQRFQPVESCLPAQSIPSSIS